MTNGKMKINSITLQQLFNAQVANQNKLIQKGVYDRYKDKQTIFAPVDDIGLASYHVQQLMSEIGEVLDADKRWKSHRNDKYNKQDKLEELVDCFVVLMNIAMFSGFNGDDIGKALQKKLSVISDRIEKLGGHTPSPNEQREKLFMNNIEKMKVYFASPWFNPDQAEREDRVKRRLRELGFNIWSPKENCVCSPIEDEKVRNKVYGDNVHNIKKSDIIFAITDGKDMGTIWEAGFANGYNAALGYKKIKVVYYCETLGNGQFNLMLAQSGDIVITSFEDLDKLPELIRKGEGLKYAGIVE